MLRTARCPFWGLVMVAVMSLPPVGAAGQSATLLRLRNAASADRLVVDSAGGLVVRGGPGVIPATGGQPRMMWYPAKWAFRAGYPQGNAWDDANVGYASAAFGMATRAGGMASFATGSGALATGDYAFAAGTSTQATGAQSFAAGNLAQATGLTSMALGYSIQASGQYSVAIGTDVFATHNGAVMLGDASSATALFSAAANEFTVRAAGGVRLFTSSGATSGVTLAAGGSAWNVVSDRRRKEAFLPIDGEDVLARIRTLPLSTWRYLAEADGSTRHIGPMAQDWSRAFGFSRDSLTINTGDVDGVNLAGVQALEARTRAQAERLTEQDAVIAALRAELNALRASQSAREAEQARTLAGAEARLHRLELLLAGESEHAAARPVQH